MGITFSGATYVDAGMAGDCRRIGRDRVDQLVLPPRGSGGRQECRRWRREEVTVRVHGGYDPAHVTAKLGSPVRLIFDRQETSGCSEEVVFPDFGVRKFLRPFEKTVVELMPEKPGSYEFTCGMSMLRGRLIIEAAQ